MDGWTPRVPVTLWGQNTWTHLELISGWSCPANGSRWVPQTYRRRTRPIWVAPPDILRDGAVGWLNGGASNLAGGSYSGGQAGDALDFMGPARHLPSALSHLPSSQRSPQDLTV